jgi:predicted hotdog family 3-hydroxylacyl-ACP dehydratase
VLGAARIGALIPQQGAMCLLASAVRWDARGVLCRAVSHLDPGNPLRAAGRLGAVIGAEYGMQAAALHGALRGDGRPGVIAALRDLRCEVARLDQAEFGTLTVRAWRQAGGVGGLIYAFTLRAASGRLLVAGQGTVIFPPAMPRAVEM